MRVAHRDVVVVVLVFAAVMASVILAARADWATDGAVRSATESVPSLTLGAGNASGGDGQDGVAVGAAWTVGDIDPCVDHGTVTVVGFRFSHPHDLVLDGWGHRPNPYAHGAMMDGGAVGTITSHQFQTGPATIDDLCSDTTTADGDEFAFQFHRTTAGRTGWAEGLIALYRAGSGNAVHTALLPHAYGLCGGTIPPGSYRSLCG